MSSFHLIVLRPFRPARELHYATSAENGNGEVEFRRQHFSQDRLYEDIFHWSPDLDVWSGVADEDKRTRLKAMFLDTFQPAQPVEDRTFQKLKELVDELQATLQAPPADMWLPTSQFKTDTEGDDFPVCVPPMIAFIHHLTWIYETFQHVPDLALMVR